MVPVPWTGAASALPSRRNNPEKLAEADRLLGPYPGGDTAVQGRRPASEAGFVAFRLGRAWRGAVEAFSRRSSGRSIPAPVTSANICEVLSRHGPASMTALTAAKPGRLPLRPSDPLVPATIWR